MLLFKQKLLVLSLLLSFSSCVKKPLIEVKAEVPIETKVEATIEASAEVKIASSEVKQEGSGNVSITIKDGMISILSLATFLSFLAFFIRSAQKKKFVLLLSLVVKGIELADSDAVKKVIKTLSERDNVEKALDTFVQRTT